MKKKKRLSGIERRWFVNNVGVIMLLVAAGVFGVVFSVAAYYDTNLRSGLENKAKTTTDFFSNYISQSYKEYYQSCIKFAQPLKTRTGWNCNLFLRMESLSLPPMENLPDVLPRRPRFSRRSTASRSGTTRVETR